jgi:hypothetical protein
MTRINQMNNYNLINFSDSQDNNNENEDQFNIDFVIDRTPNINLIYNLQNIIINQHFDEIFAEGFEAIIDGTAQFNTDNDIHELDTTDEFIQFQSLPIYKSVIEYEVNQIHVSEEERECIICYETKECQDISQINCGHKFCSNCLIKIIRINIIEPLCPLCRYNITHITFQTHQYNDTFLQI